MRWLRRLYDKLRRPTPAERWEIEHHQRKAAKDWERVREASADLASLIEDALRGDDESARGQRH